MANGEYSKDSKVNFFCSEDHKDFEQYANVLMDEIRYHPSRRLALLPQNMDTDCPMYLYQQ
ncbi:hypothetical protein MAE30S32_45830 [Microcystis aeruginosa 11-30S32]|uniref:Uncharacterized protein n=1 Tax=Microcystis aeruginosa 11-30S32 TaxID=2358142 RepID=A0A510PQF8_MICAE|nr:hypothetical protein MAE30S32_45830 [Microcystis aeruginosa 11-30S32]